MTATQVPAGDLRKQVSQLLVPLDKEAPLAVVLTFRLGSQDESAFLARSAQLTRESRGAAGTDLFAFHRALQPPPAPGAVEYLLYADSRSARDFERLWNSASFDAFLTGTAALLTAAPELRVYSGWHNSSGNRLFDGLARAVSGALELTQFGIDTAARIVTGAIPGGSGSPSAPSPAAGGWGPMPFPVPPLGSPAPHPAPGPVPTPPGAEFPYEAHYARIPGARIHYIDEGDGDPILFIHGNPTWSYVWRNVIPHLVTQGRCIAPDLAGFGRSSKPDIEYSSFEHAAFLEAFIEKLCLKNLTLVMHDQGALLGLWYAMRNPANVKAIAFFEANLRPVTWDNFSTPEFRALFRIFRTGGVHGEGWKAIVDRNVFIEELLPKGVGRPLSEREMKFYREPFLDPGSRVPIWRFVQDSVIGGEPADVAAAVGETLEKLQRSSIPKLLLFAEPGSLVDADYVKWAKSTFPNLTAVSVGPGVAFLEESSPDRIGRAVAEWRSSIGLAGSRR